MNIENGSIETLKHLDLPQILRSDGYTPKQKSPSSYIMNCPFHEDKTPSFSISLVGSRWLWHCFGCGKGGDAVKYSMLKKNLSYPEAIRQILPGDSQNKISSAKLLGRVAEHYHKTLKENTHAQKYLEKRGLLDFPLIKDYQLGFSDGTLPKDRDCLNALKDLGILNENHNEHFYQCLVFPIENKEGQIVSLYGRHIQEKKHLYPKGPHQGVFNQSKVRNSKRIFITEGIIDALSLMKLGLKETLALYGTSGFTAEHETILKNPSLEEIFLCLDNDEAGQKAAAILREKLLSLGKKIFKINLPKGTKDPNDFLLSAKSKDEFLSLAEELTKKNSLAIPSAGWTVTREQDSVLFQNCKKSYRVKGLNLNGQDTLKISLKVQNDKDMHLDTLDLYSARQREIFIRQTKKLLDLDEACLQRDLNFLVDELEKIQAKHVEKMDAGDVLKSAMTDEERKEALNYLKDPKLIENILLDVKSMGHVGEENNFLLGYLVSLSRKLKNPLALFIVSQSAAGKTQLQDMILNFTPPEDYLKLTRLTDQSLFYLEKDSLVHKLLAIEEEEGARGAGYSIRHLLSAQGLSNMATVKNEETGLMRSAQNEVKGPSSVMITTTNPEINYETYSRFIVMTVDESREQTKNILKLQRSQETFKGLLQKRGNERIKRLHQNIQRLILPLEVVNPHSEKLTFTDNILRARREQKKYLTLIKTVALLRQHQKEVQETTDNGQSLRYIEADKADIRIANLLARDVFLKGLSEMTPQTKKVLPLIKDLVDKRAREERKDSGAVVISRRDIREHTGWTDYQLRKQIHELEELEYLIPVAGQNGKRFTYVLMWDGKDTQKGLDLSDIP